MKRIVLTLGLGLLLASLAVCGGASAEDTKDSASVGPVKVTVSGSVTVRVSHYSGGTHARR